MRGQDLRPLREGRKSALEGARAAEVTRDLKPDVPQAKALASIAADLGGLSIPLSISDTENTRRFVSERTFRLPPKKGPRVVLLQGPVGPFFKHLQDFLGRSGFDTWQVTFNAGDHLFAGSEKRVSFNGGREAWPDWFRSFIAAADVDHVIMFGSEREVHSIARLHAEALGVNVLSFEEGYIRPGFITVEQGANNWLSPMAGKLPPSSFRDGTRVGCANVGSKAFKLMCAYGAIYYTISTLFSQRSQRQLFHRQVRLLPEAFAWTRNFYRWTVHQSKNFSTIGKLLEHQVGRYFIVPLQMASDTQMRRAALGWSNARLITETLGSFARSAPATHRLVFKIHPLERGHGEDRELATLTAQSLGVADRVDIIDTGSIGLLARHSAGMITINSTSGLSAIFHGVPLLVVGNAFYAHEKLATCGRGTPDFDAFWKGGHVADDMFRQRYLGWIKEMCLRPGDFYDHKGILEACEGILDLLRPEVAADSEAARAA